MHTNNFSHFFFFRWNFALVVQAGVQWHDLGSLQPPSPKFKWFSSSASQVAGIISMHHHIQQIFCIFSRDGISPCWSDWSQTPYLKWSSCLGLPKWWDYRHEPLCPAYFWLLLNLAIFCWNLDMMNWVKETSKQAFCGVVIRSVGKESIL